jgi:gamma-glutamylcyclotransferase (GGCT)/AIG2-like uncharacterized protein YtfP
LGWRRELRATGRAIESWHRGAARTADLADLRSAVRNMVKGRQGVRGEVFEVGLKMVTMLDESV